MSGPGLIETTRATPANASSCPSTTRARLARSPLRGEPRISDHDHSAPLCPLAADAAARARRFAARPRSGVPDRVRRSARTRACARFERSRVPRARAARRGARPRARRRGPRDAGSRCRRAAGRLAVRGHPRGDVLAPGGARAGRRPLGCARGATLVGLALQLPFALLAYAAALLLLRVADALVLGGGTRRTLGGIAALSVPIDLHLTPLPLLARGHARRGPPRSG